VEVWIGGEISVRVVRGSSAWMARVEGCMVFLGVGGLGGSLEVSRWWRDWKRW